MNPKIKEYLMKEYIPVKKVVFGGHWSNNPGWLLLNQEDQDLTKPINCPDNVLDCVYTEHVVEHLPFNGAINFFKESFRILKSDGYFRLVLPCLETILDANLDSPQGDKYNYTSLEPHFFYEDKALKELELDGLEVDRKLFLLNSMSNKNEHTFLWSLKLLKPILKQIGFKNITVQSVGQGLKPEFCIERRQRGLYIGNDWKEDQESGKIWDCESGIIEATK